MMQSVDSSLAGQ